ncbi:hypothetical protein AXF42_Ash012701 [Apostasia shenzhenica]|uniref:Uncharacterized protein n=1 Tax=Apostasia shenzhenica TaxID=1088818 RepID=A0A2H9ZTF9_9ASPA|nr:hypothetical protein AXF42_Ash012701 [Apostasia shenzhenica]
MAEITASELHLHALSRMGLLQTFATSPAVWERPGWSLFSQSKAKQEQKPSTRSPASPKTPSPSPSQNHLPTPLLISSSPPRRIADEALDRILLDLHSTLARGVRVDASTSPPPRALLPCRSLPPRASSSSTASSRLLLRPSVDLSSS